MILRALERRAEEPGALEQRFQTLLGLDPKLVHELASMDESTSREHILRMRASLRTKAGVQLVESMIERVSVRTHLGLVKSASVSMTSSAASLLLRAQQRLATAVAELGSDKAESVRVGCVLEDVDEALRRDPDSIEALLLRARARTLDSRFRDLARARRDLDRISKMAPSDGRVWCVLGEIHVAQGHPKVALHAYQHALSAETPDFNAYLSRAALRLQLGEPSRAEADARSFISLFPDKPKGHAMLGMALRRRCDVAGAFDCLEQALELDPDSVDALLERASLYADLGHSDRALADFDRAVALSEAGPAHFRRGSLRLVLGDLRGAESDFTLALDRNPEDLVAKLNRGTVRLLRRDEPGASLDLSEAARTHPDSALARMKWGLLLLQLERSAEALVELRAALAFAPTDWPHRAQIESTIDELIRRDPA